MSSSSNDWQSFGPDQKFKYLILSGTHSDCSFIVQTKKFFGHKSILMFNSPVFEAMLYGQFSESSNSQDIEISDVNAADFENFLYFVYTQNMAKLKELSFESLRSLTQVANKYLSTGLLERCYEAIEFKLSNENNLQLRDVFMMFDLGHLMDKPNLIDACSNKLKTHKWPETQTVHNAVNTFDLSTCVLKELLKVLEGVFPAVTLLKLIETYVEYHTGTERHGATNEKATATRFIKKENHDGKIIYTRERDDKITLPSPAEANNNLTSEIIDELTDTLNFNTLRLNEYIDGPGESKLLSVAQKYKHLTMLIKKKQIYIDERLLNYTYSISVSTLQSLSGDMKSIF